MFPEAFELEQSTHTALLVQCRRAEQVHTFLVREWDLYRPRLVQLHITMKADA